MIENKRDLDREWIWALNNDDLPICGCGRPETAWSLIRDVLRLCPFFDNPQAVRDLFKEEGSYHIVLGVLTEADLIEHGGGVGGSWLTPDGGRLLRILNEADDIDEWYEEWIDSHD